MRKAFYTFIFTLAAAAIIASAKSITDVKVLKNQSQNSIKKVQSVKIDIREIRKDIRDIKNYLMKQ